MCIDDIDQENELVWRRLDVWCLPAHKFQEEGSMPELWIPQVWGTWPFDLQIQQDWSFGRGLVLQLWRSQLCQSIKLLQMWCNERWLFFRICQQLWRLWIWHFPPRMEDWRLALPKVFYYSKYSLYFLPHCHHIFTCFTSVKTLHLFVSTNTNYISN